jgi:hypothetical protein
MKEDKEQRDLRSFVGEAIGVTGAVPLDEVMGFHFAQVVADLGERIGRGREGITSGASKARACSA